jgi:hypothetical protein
MHFRKLRGTDSLWKRFERFDRSQYHIKRGLGLDKKAMQNVHNDNAYDAP